MKKLRVLVVGLGNVGRGVLLSLGNNDDMELAGVVSRTPERVKKELPGVAVVKADDIAGIKALNADVAILCGGSKNDLPLQGPQFASIINTVDSFDHHDRIPEYFAAMDTAAKASGKVSVISTGWDPGVFSLERVLANAFIPGAVAKGFYGLGEKGGLSMGHSDALRTIPGVKDARQYTHAVPEAIEAVRAGKAVEFKAGDLHTRECFVVLEEGADPAKVEQEIKTMPNYFSDYDTTVHFISEEEMKRDHSSLPHGGFVMRSGVTGREKENHHLIEYTLKLDSNPEFTSSVLVAYARAAYRMASEGMSGCKTVFDIAPAYLSAKSPEELRASML